MRFCKATQILRGYNLEQVKGVCDVLCKGSKVRNVEITLNTDGAIKIIENVSNEYGDKLNIGAGTVLDYEGLVEAHNAGAKFVLSPSVMTQRMLDYCTEHGIISVPGAFSPSEISASFNKGADIVKVFPSNELSYGYANKVKEPIGNVKLMAVGGVNKNNVSEILKSGYDFVGTAGGIFEKQDILKINKERMLKSLFEFERELP